LSISKVIRQNEGSLRDVRIILYSSLGSLRTYLSALPVLTLASSCHLIDDTTIGPSTHLTSLEYEGRVMDTLVFDQVQGKTVASKGRRVSHSGKMANGVLINSDANH
jgi:hypothetical protein